jgi:lipopolysaccharide/colanic/teichoic acid biosynthesis glycosyltransferase
MRNRTPTSRSGFAVHLSIFDAMLAILAPFVALFLRNAQILSPFDAISVSIYVIISFFCALIAFIAFRVRGGVPAYLSVHDVVDLTKAVCVAELMICIAMFTITRLQGIPRSVPVIHAMILGAGLFAARMLAHYLDKSRRLAVHRRPSPVENVILIGLNELSSLFIKIAEVCNPGEMSVIAVLDENPRSRGRSLHGTRVLGSPLQIDTLIAEFAVHGVDTDRVVVSGSADTLATESVTKIREVCRRRGINLSFVPDLFNLTPLERAKSTDVLIPPTFSHFRPRVAPAGYFRYKRRIEAVLALILLGALLPLWLIAGVIVFFDVGPPILFWQRRLGLNGVPFQLYKLRTLRSPFGRNGEAVSEEGRLSWSSKLLRRMRLDEVPQLLSVLVGDMSLVGPRPLLPQDQPADPTLRLSVRPGITGWAQVNGGNLLSPGEKEALDVWYIRHASLLLDLRIALMTVRSLFRGDHRPEGALADAWRERDFPIPGYVPRAMPEASSRFAPPAGAAGSGDHSRSVA